LYAGEVSYVDHYFGEFYNALSDLGLLERSIVVVLADHGHPLADHGKFLKGTDRLYGELLKVPFMIRLPSGKHAVIDAVVQFPERACSHSAQRGGTQLNLPGARFRTSSRIPYRRRNKRSVPSRRAALQVPSKMNSSAASNPILRNKLNTRVAQNRAAKTED